VADRILELKHITKTFPGVKALEDVHFDLQRGEIHALVGENGAGKSTFIKVITGVHQPDAGQIFFDGVPVAIHGPADSQQLGIAAIYQHVTCYPDLSVTENVFIGHEKVHPVLRNIDWQTLHRRTADLLRQLDADFDPRTPMGTLTVARQQIVEIAKALSTNARIIIMDEPTAALTARESEDLYRIAEALRDKGVSIIFISHRMEDIYRLASRVTVLRDGRYVGTWNLSEVRRDELITTSCATTPSRSMTGRSRACSGSSARAAPRCARRSTASPVRTADACSWMARNCASRVRTRPSRRASGTFRRTGTGRA
jgi:rhamnose transport system ATP-binding protein